MKKGNWNIILIVVLIILGLVFVISYFSEGKYLITGLAPPGEPSGTCNDGCIDGTPTEACSDTQPLLCEVNGVDCVLVNKCTICGCPSGKSCNIDTENCYTPTTNTGGDSTNTNPIGCNYNNDCNVEQVCILDENKLEGICTGSMVGDGICAIDGVDGYNGTSETCESSPLDCEGLRADCGINEVCKAASYNGITSGACTARPVPHCEDGTLGFTCSINTPGGYCQPINNYTSSNLIGLCTLSSENAGCPCPENYLCNSTSGYCYQDITNTTQYPQELIDNYCEHYGGNCLNSCGNDSYELIESEYAQLINDCKPKKCCYPYANADDEINDCEYYNGTCMNECGDNYYYSDVGYLDDECGNWVQEGYKCCIEYPEGYIKEDRDISEPNVLNALFGPNEVSSEDSNTGTIRLSEYISLNRDIAFWTIIVFVVAIFSFIALYPNINKKRSKKKRR